MAELGEGGQPRKFKPTQTIERDEASSTQTYQSNQSHQAKSSGNEEDDSEEKLQHTTTFN
jgi:hypothetical protein